MRYCICIVLLVQSICFSQTILWEKSYGSFTKLYSNIESFDTLGGNFVLAVSEDNTARYRHRLIMVNGIGDTIWTKHYADTIFSNYRCPVRILNNTIYYSPNFEIHNGDTVGIMLMNIKPDGSVSNTYRYRVDNLTYSYARQLYDIDNELYFFGSGGNDNIPYDKGGGIS